MPYLESISTVPSVLWPLCMPPPFWPVRPSTCFHTTLNIQPHAPVINWTCCLSNPVSEGPQRLGRATEAAQIVERASLGCLYLGLQQDARRTVPGTRTERRATHGRGACTALCSEEERTENGAAERTEAAFLPSIPERL